MAVTLGAIVDALGGELHGDPAWVVLRLEPLESARGDSLSFLSHPKYRSMLASSQAGCVIVSPALKEDALRRGACIVTPEPYLYFARLTQLWRNQHRISPVVKVHPSAVVDASAKVHPSAQIGPLCVVEAHAEVGEGTVLAARVFVGASCRVGARCLLHPGVVIGADGFGFASHQGAWVKIEQLGAVTIGDDVEIGANTCIDRGALTDTVIEHGVKLDNLIQIGHNVHIGAHTAMAGCVGVAGSAHIGAHCTVGGGAIILGHLRLVDGVHVSAATVVTRSILQPGHYTGMFPMDENSAWEKNAASLKQLYSLRQRVKSLEQRILENEKDRT